MPIGKFGGDFDRPPKSREGAEPTGAEAPADPEAEHVAKKAAGPGNDDKRREVQRARRGGIAENKASSRLWRERIGEHKAVRRFAVLANDIEERRKIGWKQQGALYPIVCCRQPGRYHLAADRGQS